MTEHANIHKYKRFCEILPSIIRHNCADINDIISIFSNVNEDSGVKEPLVKRSKLICLIIKINISNTVNSL